MSNYWTNRYKKEEEKRKEAYRKECYIKSLDTRRYDTIGKVAEKVEKNSLRYLMYFMIFGTIFLFFPNFVIKNTYISNGDIQIVYNPVFINREYTVFLSAICYLFAYNSYVGWLDPLDSFQVFILPKPTRYHYYYNQASLKHILPLLVILIMLYFGLELRDSDKLWKIVIKENLITLQ